MGKDQAKGLKSSRVQSMVDAENVSCGADNIKKIESLPEIFSRLGQLGYTLDLFDEKDEESLYQIFQEVVDSGSQFPYECSSIKEFHRQFFTPQGQVYV